MAKKKPKEIKTIRKLVSMFRNGELEDYMVRVDNDGAWLEWVDDDKNMEEVTQEYEWWGDGYRDVVEVWQAAGVLAEWV